MRKGVRQENRVELVEVGNSGAVDGYGVARERGTTKEVTKEVFGERS